MSDARGVALADPDLPRSNGELAFDEPWQGRALAMAIALVEALGVEWDDFRRQLIAAIDAEPDRPYWDSWTTALDAFVTEHLPRSGARSLAGRGRGSGARLGSA